jgi:hypothetical protein
MKEILLSRRNKIRLLKTFQKVVYHQDQNIRKRNKGVSSVKRGDNEGGIETKMTIQGNEHQGEKVGKICKR